MSNQHPAVFLDRDGTLIEDVGILADPRNIQLFPDTIKALLSLQQQYLLFVVTNQSGVAQGKLRMEDVAAVNSRLHQMLLESGVEIGAWYVCPHSRDDQCDCIKPKSTFILKAANDYCLDLQKSFVIGDHPHDALTANELGVSGLYLLTGHGEKHLPDLPPDILVFQCLADAADWIINYRKQLL